MDAAREDGPALLSRRLTYSFGGVFGSSMSGAIGIVVLTIARKISISLRQRSESLNESVEGLSLDSGFAELWGGFRVLILVL